MKKLTVPRILFVTLAELGHATFTARLREFAETDERIEARWLYINPFSEARYFWEKVGRWLPAHLAYSLLVRRRVKELLRIQNKFDAYFVHTYDRGLFLPRLGRQKILIVGLDSTSLLTRRMFATTDRISIFRRLLRWFYRKSTDYLEKRVLRRADLMVSWSKWAAQSLVDDYKVPKEKVVIVPPAIAMKNIKYAAGEKKDTEKLRLLFVGGDFKRKGGPMLVELMEKGLDTVCELDVVTKDEVKYSSKYIRVHHGLNHDSPTLIKLFEAADVFVLPTTMDMLPIVLIEACAAGLPSISTKIGAIPEIVESGRTGLLIAPNDKTALKTAIEQFVSDRNSCRKMGINARYHFEQQLTAEEHFPKLIGIICNLVWKKRATTAEVCEK
ncbi:MAG TPA: glycosyltransferase family 4 protein [Phycisphaerae bacterium]|nr:glycosyltransferase family 4 protein [Phycisphaerae bacterium]